MSPRRRRSPACGRNASSSGSVAQASQSEVRVIAATNASCAKQLNRVVSGRPVLPLAGVRDLDPPVREPKERRPAAYRCLSSGYQSIVRPSSAGLTKEAKTPAVARLAGQRARIAAMPSNGPDPQ